MTRIAVIGAGLIGRERLTAVKRLIAENLPVEIAGIFDANRALCEKSAAEFGAPAFNSIDELLATNPDLVTIALPHDTAVDVTLDVLKRGHRVLLEKPMGRDLGEARRLLEAGGERLSIGFNYRYFAGIRRAIQDARRGAFGRLVAVNFILGHGCSPGQENTWKLDPIRAGGGCLIDPGVHILDLCLLLAPEKIEIAGGTSWSGFWKTGIEEDVQLLMRTADGVSFSVQISIVRWRSTFNLIVHGTEAYGEVTGRNRSYGAQAYRLGPRWGWQRAANQAASETVVVESDGLDVFAGEMRALLFPESAQGEAWPGPATAREAFAVMELLDRIREGLNLRRNYS
ncbi:MAG TPA: Gfo/Idh/MocA family oxidoreductase [Candidatus Binataceae bacterium]|nr:Gfo/Idh/MocA family oxidoreductase [Candidatus Binataceae bacterium]